MKRYVLGIVTCLAAVIAGDALLLGHGASSVSVASVSTGYVFTNSGPIADTATIVEINFQGHASGLAVTSNALGCGAPSIVSETYAVIEAGQMQLVRYYTTDVVSWPSTCVDPGEAVMVTYSEPSRSCFCYPPTLSATFYNSASPPTSPTPTTPAAITVPSPLPAFAMLITNRSAVADGLTITVEYRGYGSTYGLSVLANPPGCGTPTVTSESFASPIHPLTFPDHTTTTLRWPTPCFDTSESVIVVYTVAFGLSGYGLPIGGATFFNTGGAPVETATPSMTPTPFGATGFSMAIDCDMVTPGIQNSCGVNLGTPGIDVAVVVVNNTGVAKSLGSVDFDVHDDDISRLSPPSGGLNLDGNPDFNNAIPGSWSCPNPTANIGTDGALKAVSLLGCFVSSPPPSNALQPGGTLLLGTVHYALPPGASVGSVQLTLGHVQITDGGFIEIGSCAPLVSTPLDGCSGASITLLPALVGTSTPTLTATHTPEPATSTPTSAGIGATPTSTPTSSYFLAIDCDPLTPGLQVTCDYPANVGAIDVAIVFVNNSGSPKTIAAFNFVVRDSDRNRLVPLAGVGTNLDGNPDFDQAHVLGTFFCGAPAPNPDTGQFAPTGAASFLSCYDPAATTSPPPILPVGGLPLARVHYGVPSGALPGTINLVPVSVSVADGTLTELGSCVPEVTDPMPCLPATINLVTPPTATPTLTPTATNTPIVPGMVKVPEGNANNVDLSIPAANLYLCTLGPCAGPGEGNLLVTEHAFNVHTGDQNADTVEDGVGAYEFAVEYDNFVIQSVNPCDVVFSPGGAGAARGNVQQLAASIGCAPNPPVLNGTCSFSLILENIIRFGCVTNGQVPGPTGNFDVARLNLIPNPNLTNDIFPGNNNGVLTVIKDNGCELVDVFGHPMTGSINGGLVPTCGDLAVTVRILEGDLNLDCKVNVTDEQLISYRYGSFFGSLLYSKWYDLEPALHDLDIDIKDLQKVFGRDGSTCQNPVPAQTPVGPPAPFG